MNLAFAIGIFLIDFRIGLLKRSLDSILRCFNRLFALLDLHFSAVDLSIRLRFDRLTYLLLTLTRESEDQEDQEHTRV